jgi:hypothetical protein
MATFSLSRPQSMYAAEPQYATGSEKARLAFLGYKSSGEQNTFGKIMSWQGGLGIAQNAMARNYAQKIGATDAWENIKEDTDNRLMKQGVLAGAALMAAGGIAAAPALGGILAGGGAAAAGAGAAASGTAALGGVAGVAGGASAAATAAGTAAATGGAIGAAAGAAGGGALSAGTQLFKTGLGMTSNFAGMLAFDQDEDSEDSNYIYR